MSVIFPSPMVLPPEVGILFSFRKSTSLLKSQAVNLVSSLVQSEAKKLETLSLFVRPSCPYLPFQQGRPIVTLNSTIGLYSQSQKLTQIVMILCLNTFR